MNRPRVILADDHRMLAEGLRGILEPEFELIKIVTDGRQLVQAALELKPDAIVADITMPQLNGIDAVEQLRLAGSTAKVVFLTMHQDVTYAQRAWEIGASGFVLKHTMPSELIGALWAALRGERYFASHLRDRAAREVDSQGQSRSSAKNGLTNRQREILQLYAEGRSAKEIAAILHISSRTAENHKARILAILGLRSSAELVQYAVRHGMIPA